MTPELKQMLIDGFVPKWLDKQVLAIVTGNSPDTIDNWAAQGIIPAPLAEAMERVVCAVDYVLLNPKLTEHTNEVLREELAKFDAVRKAAPSGRRG